MKPAPRRTVLAGALAAFVLAFAGSLWLHRGSALHDTDAYYHLAVARAYWQEGLAGEGLPWARFSLMRDGFGDKELAFHLLLAPLAGRLDPLVAGRLALALAAAALAAALAAFAVRALGWWGVAVPFWLFFASTELAWRLVRLRPELLSLLLLLAAVAAIGGGRHRLLGLVALLYTLSYTAFQAFAGLVALAFVFFGWARRRWDWPMLLYTVLGIGLGLLLHPHFPENLEVWAAQNVQYFLLKGELDVGTEIRANFTDVTLMVNLGWLLGLAALGLSSRAAPQAGGDDQRLAEALGLAALAFGGLYLSMSRFSVYFFPFATLWAIHGIRRRGRWPSAWVRLPGRERPRLPLAAAAALCLLVSWPEAARQLGNYRHRTRLGPNEERIRDRERLSAALPEGARVAADWGPTATYMLWAPQGRYLNVLDPLFMALPHPDAHRRLEAILEGEEPDVPLTAAAALDSDYLAYPTAAAPRLEERLAGDPRVEVLHRGSHTLVRFRPGGAPFVLDWRRLPAGVEPTAAAVADLADWPSYPRAPDERQRRLEGYVDAERLSADACVGLARQVEVAAPARSEVLLAPYGPTSVWLDGTLLLAVEDDLEAVLERGVRLPLALAAGAHRLTVVTCRAGGAERKGFYWSQR